MGRQARRAQARAERRQRRQQQQPVRRRAQQAALSGGTTAETARGGSLLKPRWATDIISELRRVTWPSRGEVGYLTVVVIVVSLAIGTFLGLADVGFGWLIEQTILN